MALNAAEQELLDVAKAMLPDWFTSDARQQEFLGLAAKMMGSARRQAEHWRDMARILKAVGATATEPDWLNQHAIDRGTSRQEGESTAALRERLRNVPQALTRPFLLSAITEIVSEAGEPTSPITMIELPRDMAYYGKQQKPGNTGGTFVISGSFVEFTPDDLPWPINPWNQLGAFNGRTLFRNIAFSGSNSAGNDGSFQVVGLNGNAVVFSNGSAVAEVDPGVSWELEYYEVNGALFNDNRDDFYFSRGYRIGKVDTQIIIVTLPFGCTEGTRQSVLEMLRQKKGAGVIPIVECRANP